MNAQYFIDNDLVTCTVFNDSGMAFYSSEKISAYPTLIEALDKVFLDAKRNMESYQPQSDEVQKLI